MSALNLEDWKEVRGWAGQEKAKSKAKGRTVENLGVKSKGVDVLDR
ncbi:hypothetical protein KNP414_06083 [Paenibacillus mucilaginosus KNP414]|uniref:Uncharacterized protein n=1 Tax=Paenibacillus mucilaginosus (strain KNP414) TaxID=1036673 RepID=F8FGE7_PAEMK|nr:hypothetical protein KNP414_06083 [Paenibacillus mucilaginosus KNP414]